MADVMKEIGITRMDCPTCTATIEKSVMKVPGVKKAQANYLKKTLKVTCDETTPLTAIEKAIEDVGYQVAYKRYQSPLSRLRGLFGRGENKSVTAITDKDFNTKVLLSKNPAVVLFSSKSCPSCQIFKPKFRELAEKQAGTIDFYDLDITNNEIWKEYNIMSLPSVIIFRDGKPTTRFVSMLQVEELEKALTT